MKKENPFTLSFGQLPVNYISRNNQSQIIIDNFKMQTPTNSAWIISGVRGSGKTVMLTEIAHTLRDEPHWHVIDLNPNLDMLSSLNSKIHQIKGYRKKYSLSSATVSTGFANISAKSETGFIENETAIEICLKEMEQKGERLLITVDEVSNNQLMRAFAHSFQSFKREGYPIFLLMTGLFQNINSLADSANMTFLHRTPRMILEPLSLSAVRDSYMMVLGVPNNKAIDMAKLTCGYPYAYQILGYLFYNAKSQDLSQLIPDYDQNLRMYVYEKLWSEFSPNEKTLLAGLADLNGSVQTEQLRAVTGMGIKTISVYKDRLKRQGIIQFPSHGQVSFVLPRFSEFVKDMMEFEGN